MGAAQGLPPCHGGRQAESPPPTDVPVAPRVAPAMASDADCHGRASGSTQGECCVSASTPSHEAMAAVPSTAAPMLAPELRGAYETPVPRIAAAAPSPRPPEWPPGTLRTLFGVFLI